MNNGLLNIEFLAFLYAVNYDDPKTSEMLQHIRNFGIYIWKVNMHSISQSSNTHVYFYL